MAVASAEKPGKTVTLAGIVGDGHYATLLQPRSAWQRDQIEREWDGLPGRLHGMTVEIVPDEGRPERPELAPG